MKKSRHKRTILEKFPFLEDGNYEGFCRFLDENPNVMNKCFTKKNKTMLHLIAYYGQNYLLEEFYKRFPKIDLNILDSEGNTALHLAAKQESFSCVKFLIEHGAQPSILNFKDKAPIQFTKNNEIINYLLAKYDPNFSSRLFENVRENSSLVNRFHLLDRHRGDKSSSHFIELYRKGEIQTYNTLFDEGFDPRQILSCSSSLAEYIQKNPINDNSWNIYYKVVSKIMKELLETNKKIDSKFLFSGLVNAVQVKVPSERFQQLNDLQRVLKNIIELEVDENTTCQFIDATALSCFAYGVRQFFAPIEVINELVSNFNDYKYQSKLRAMYVIKEIILHDSNYLRINKERILECLSNLKAKDNSLNILEIADALESICLIQKDFYLSHVPPSLNGKHKIEELTCYIRGVSDKKKAALLAKDIRQINMIYYLCLSCAEFEKNKLEMQIKSDSSQQLPSVLLVDFFDNLSRTISYSILFHDEQMWDKKLIKLAANRIGFYLQVAEALINDPELPDYHGAYSIYSALNSASISRLNVWDDLGSDLKKIKNYLDSIFDQGKNQIQLRTLQEKPCIPFLGILQKDFVFAMESDQLLINRICVIGKIFFSISKYQYYYLNMGHMLEISSNLLEYIGGILREEKLTSNDKLYELSLHIQPRSNDPEIKPKTHKQLRYFTKTMNNFTSGSKKPSDPPSSFLAVKRRSSDSNIRKSDEISFDREMDNYSSSELKRNEKHNSEEIPAVLFSPRLKYSNSNSNSNSSSNNLPNNKTKSNFTDKKAEKLN